MDWPYIGSIQTPPNATPPDTTREPVEIIAGNDLYWTRELPSYPAGTFALTYYLRGGRGNAEVNLIVAVPDGKTHVVEVESEITAAWTPGLWQLNGFASSTGKRGMVYDGLLTIRPDPATAGLGDDLRSHNKRVLDSIRAVLEGRATDDVLSSSIEGTQLSRIPIPDLLLLKDRYEYAVRTDEMRARAKQGLATGSTYLTTFRTPR